jgi:2-polyprenyl-3-methyl-5-hydroxy-6-metoxy-1,4-benzoquinol methylase
MKGAAMTGSRQPPAAIDWGAGHYETTAAQLAPAAAVAVQRASLRSGERVLDLGCGTGNAALLAVRADTTVTGVDPAVRLLKVARDRAAAEGAEMSAYRTRSAINLSSHCHHRHRPHSSNAKTRMDHLLPR